MPGWNQEDYERLNTLLSTPFARFTTEMIQLAAFCFGAAWLLAIILIAVGK